MKVLEMLSKLKHKEFCTPNCFGCCGDGEIDITCSAVRDNFEKELLKYYQPKLPKDSIVLSKEEYDDMFTFKTVGNGGKHCGFYNILDTVRKVEREKTAEKCLQLLESMKVHEDGRHEWRDHHNDCIDKCKAKFAKEFEIELKE